MEQDDYFAWRNVNPTTYKNYKIPAYLRNALSSTGTDASILDFGCGFGQLLNALGKAGYSHIEGADINPAAIAHLRNLSMVVHNLEELTNFYEDFAERYDYVVMSHVLEHFPKEEAIPQLTRVRRLLKPGGALIIMVPNAQSNTGCYWAYEDFTHYTLFTAGSLYYVLRAAGFTQVEFIDVDCNAGVMPLVAVVRKGLLAIYRLNLLFWNMVTGSAFHAPSPRIFSYEIKALARMQMNE